MIKFSKKKKNTVSDEAADLFARIQAGEASEAELAQMADWADEAPEKLAEMEEMSTMWEQIGDVRPDPALLREEQSAQGKASSVGFLSKLEGWLLPKPAWGGALVAAMVALVVMIVNTSFSPDPVSYATARGEVRDVALADGSVLSMNGLSGVDIAYNSESRIIQMDRGEVYFDVAPDKEKPFVVVVADTRVQAIGTEFNIERFSTELIVTVTEGIVDITLPAHINYPSKVIRAEVGTRVAIDTAETGEQPVQASQLEEGALNKSASWRQGVVHFDGEPLYLAVEKLNRGARKRIVVGNNRLKNIPIYGTFELRNAEGFLMAIENLHNIRRAERDGAIYLFPK